MCAQQAKGGTPIRNANFQNVVGTLGCVVQSRSEPTVRYVLSAAHVMNPGGYASRGDAIEAKLDGDWQKIGELEDWTPLRDASGRLHRCDAAIARITAPERVSPEVESIGAPSGVAATAGRDKRLQLHSAGRRIEARVHSSGNQPAVHYEDPFDGSLFSLDFERQILYGPVSGPFRDVTESGDSGTLVLDDRRFAVGLHIARTDDFYPIQASVCTPLQTVLDDLDVDLVVASVVDSPLEREAGPVLAKLSSPRTDPDELSAASSAAFALSVMPQLVPHATFDSVRWLLSPQGLVVNERLDRSAGRLVTVPKVWGDFGDHIRAAAVEFQVPVELIVATICTESSGNINVPSRPESNGRLSVGLMQTLIGTAREALPDEDLDERKLKDPLTSIRAGTAYIDQRRRLSLLDPPLVACIYNSGGIHFNDGAANRWKLRQFPIGSSAHLDRFTQWFNDCFAFFSEQPDQAPANAPSFWRLFWGVTP